MNFTKNNYDNLLMVLSISLIFFMICNISFWSLDAVGLGRTDYAFMETYLINDSFSEDNLIALAHFSELQGHNCIITGNYLTVGDGYNMFPCDLYIYISEISSNLKINLSNWENTYNGIYVGSSFHNLIRKEQAANTIAVHGQNYSVCGFLPKTDIEDKRVFLLWNNMDSYHRKSFFRNMNLQKNTNYCVRFESNKEINSESILCFLGNDALRIKKTNSKSGLFSFQEKMIRIISLLLLGFLVIAGAMITDLWMERRTRQYLICRAFGYNKAKILILIFKEIGLLNSIALIIGFNMELIYIHVIVGVYWDLIKTLWTVTISFLVSITIQSFIIARPIFKILHTYPTQGNIDST